ncbi:Cyclic AMP receptor-like protein [compost metagenome]
MNDMKNSEVVLMAAELNLLTKHATAASTVQMKDQDKIWRVVVNLASHPDVAHRPGGVEVKATREEIRRLAGVERRSASRAFHLFQEKGLVVFSGYKRFFFAHGKEGLNAD